MSTVGIRVLFLILEGMLSTVTIEYDVCCKVVMQGIYYVGGTLPLYPFAGSFYCKRMLKLAKCFSPSIEMIIGFVSFTSLIWCILLIDL